MIRVYEYTDKVIRYLTKKLIRTFSNAKISLLSFDELNVLDYTSKMYDTLRADAVKAYWLLAMDSYKKNLAEGVKGKLTSDWLDDYLLEYNPVMKYVYEHEVERKAAKFAESVIASPNRTKEIDVGMRSWSKMTNWFAVDVTDAATLKAYQDSGVVSVIWETERDGRQCEECDKRNGRVYPIDRVPPKPHPGCRCKLRPYQRKG